MSDKKFQSTASGPFEMKPSPENSEKFQSDCTPRQSSTHHVGVFSSTMGGLDLSTLLTALVIASLALHIPTYMWRSDVSLESARPPGTTRVSPWSHPGATTSQSPGVTSLTTTKRYGDPADSLLGDPFDGTGDYVCHTSFTSVRIVNRDPLIMYIEGFLRKGEPEWIMAMADPMLSRSSVVDVDDEPREKRNFSSEFRTSSTAFLPRAGDPILRCIEARAATLTGVPVKNTEGLQVTYYREGQYYKPHWDYFPREFASMGEQLKRGGQRVTTTFAYLNTVPLPSTLTSAPNTLFPPSYTPPDTPSTPGKPELVGAGSTQFPDLGVEVFPVKGAAAVWWDVDLKGQDDP
ncbi:putative P4H isoform 1, partial [Gonapodya sp. JEL0774]